MIDKMKTVHAIWTIWVQLEAIQEKLPSWPHGTEVSKVEHMADGANSVASCW